MSDLAIVIPYYKKEFFDKCLASLAAQTNKNFNTYIGNDNSPQDPEKLIYRYEKEFNLKYVKFIENYGTLNLTKQWERCIALTKEEEWIIILGDDDIMEPNCVAEFYFSLNDIENRGIKVIRFASMVMDGSGNELSRRYKHPFIEDTGDFLMRKLKGETRSSLSEYVFKKRNLKATGFKEFPLAWYSDLLAILEVSNFGEIYTINNAVVHFRLSGFNITSKDDNLTLKNIATFQFFYYLLRRKRNFFNSEQIDFLCNRLERTFLNNKKNLLFWGLFTKLYLERFYIKRYIFFSFQVLKLVVKKKIWKK